MKLLFLTSRFPYPLEKGDKLRAYYLIKSLSKHFDIYLFAINETSVSKKDLDELTPYCKAIEVGIVNKFSSVLSIAKNTFNKNIPFQVAYFYDEKVMQQLSAFTEKHQPEAMFCHLIRMSEYAKQLNIRRSVLDYMDTFSKGMERRGEKSNSLMSIPVKIEHERLTKYEHDIFDKFRHKIIISKQDRDWLPHAENNKIEIVANGVDTNFYTHSKSEKKFDLLFVGNMSYPPNILAVQYAAKEIMPLFKSAGKKTKLLIAGATPTSETTSLASDQIIISGWVDDVRTVFNESRIMIAPMLISIGLQNKILQGMAMEIPCVISSFANNALGATPEEEVLIADNPTEYFNQIERLLNDEDLRLRITENARKFVVKNFNWDENTNKITQMILS
ncbi:MAG TPA: glycosyltransferase [Bacteroidia bacterium]|nr:glycosyltransferase [Bacteroidia bacterium]HQF27942.1 glycosyltransferase [Bacteroidia bacterium]HQK96735.1 glycosyltransferase [Bacteroidia bacterium]